MVLTFRRLSIILQKLLFVYDCPQIRIRHKGVHNSLHFLLALCISASHEQMLLLRFAESCVAPHGRLIHRQCETEPQGHLLKPEAISCHSVHVHLNHHAFPIPASFHALFPLIFRYLLPLLLGVSACITNCFLFCRSLLMRPTE